MRTLWIGMCIMHMYSCLYGQFSEISDIPIEALDNDALAAIQSISGDWSQPIQNSSCLTIDQKDQIITFISQQELRSPYELQVIPGIPLHALRCIIHEMNSLQRPLPATGLRKSHLEIYTGIDPLSLRKFSLSHPYLLLRSKISLSPTSTCGFTYEKDSGELFWDNATGPAFLSAFFEKSFDHRTIERLVIGDFRLRLGQGLLFNNFYRKGLSFNQLSIPKHGFSDFKPYTSIDENTALRGIAVKMKFGSKQFLIPYLSHRELDGSMLNDSSQVDSILNLSSSGLHISESQLQSKNAINVTSGGFSYGRKSNVINLSFQFHFDYWHLPISSDLPLYKNFRSDHQLQMANSVSWDYRYKSLNLYGELAYRFDEGVSTILGGLWSPNDNHRFSIVFRRMPPNASLKPRMTFQQSQSGNECGLFLGYTIRWNQLYWLTLNYDSSINTWWSYQNSPYKLSHRISSSIIKKRRKHYEIRSSLHLLLRDKRTYNSMDYYERKIRWLLHYMKVVTRGVEWRSRAQLTIYDSNKITSYGWMIYQEIKAKKIGSNFSFNLRLTRYFSPVFDNRHYIYESRPAGLFSFPALSGDGTKLTALVRYRLNLASLSLFASFLNGDAIKSDFGIAFRRNFK